MQKNIIKSRLLFLIIFLIVLTIIVGLHFFIQNRYRIKNHEINGRNDLAFTNELDNFYDSSFNNTLENKNSESIQNSSRKVFLDLVEDTDPLEENEPIKEEDLKLDRKYDSYSYFAVKQCLSKFYSSKENAFNELENKVQQYDIDNFYNDNSRLCIDEIYKASIRLTKNVYYVYYRLSFGQNNYINKQIMIKIDTNNASFYVYPYEYLKSINYTDLKQDSKISLDIVNISNIERTDYNTYKQNEISSDRYDYVLELLERVKFDLNYDLEHLYNSIDNEYRKTRFSNNYNNFLNYINENKNEYLNDIFKGYQIYELGKGYQYIAICESNNHYVFNTINLMNYSIQFDNYTTSLPIYSKIYHNTMPNVRAKYCIDRVRKAINDKNYEFVYAKLNDVQKDNYYKNYKDFYNFIKTYFYDKNSFEYGDYVKISDTVYRYIVKVKDENNKESTTKTFNMTVTLKENEDFLISIIL